MGLAVDADGNVYVFEWINLRVQKFSPSGQFLLMFGGDVNQTKAGEGAGAAQRNRCPIDPGDVCQTGISGEEPSQLDKAIGDFVAYSPAPTNAILVGDKNRIQIFNLDGSYREEIPFTGVLASFAGKQVNGLDIDKDRNIYFSLNNTEDVFKLSSTGAPLNPGKPEGSSFKAENPSSVAVDVEGSVYAIDDPKGFEDPVPHVLGFSASGEKLFPTAGEGETGALFPVRTPGANLTVVATNLCEGSEEPGNLYVGVFNGGSASYVDSYGTGPVGCEPPPPNPPAIAEQFATSVGREEATVRALINPRFFQDATYEVEYGTGPCLSGGCPSKAPIPAVLLTEKAVNTPVPTAGVILEGLSPATTYHYRFVAQSSGGGPVHGIDPDGEGPENPLLPDIENGLEATFTTHAAEKPQLPCSNDAFRVGPGASLPDCRAYEMVSPLDKGNADVVLGIARNNAPSRLFELNQSALSGERLTFSAATAFGEAESAPFASQYLAERRSGGWSSEGISAPRTEAGVDITINFGPEFHGFGEDLCRGWLRLYSVAPLASDAVAKYPNLYRRENCATPPPYTAMTTVKPPNRTAEQYVDLMIKGFSADGDHTIFTAPDTLFPADVPEPELGEVLLYEHAPDGLRFVCLLPNGEPTTEACSAGTLALFGSYDVSALHNAISDDGSRIFWTAYSGSIGEAHPGRIFVRIGGKETVAVSEAVSAEPAFFWTAAEDGSKVIFSFVSGARKGQLYEFDVATETATLIADGVGGPMGASEDASRIYFASTEDLDGAGPASASARNLYLYEADPGGGAGSFNFIVALTPNDLSFVGPAGNGPPMGPVEFSPAQRAARVTPDGLHATFTSAASPTPTGYDNREPTTGEAVREVYRYDAAAKQLLCVSCNPTGARPAAGVDEGAMRVARIQGWETLNHAPRVISDDGSRIFFESHEPLVPGDSNGTWDVYQWEEPGAGTCTASRPTFSTVTGGCVDLISSGQSPARSLFLDADPSGESIFLATQSSLVGADYGLNDVYVARVGGGFPEPVPPGDCEGEACQSPPPAPPVTTPASESFRGPGNETGKVKRKGCPKGKRRVVRKGKARCAKKRSSRAGKRRRGQRGGRR
jgi:hypothetical protein